jgi:hypothetical protein
MSITEAGRDTSLQTGVFFETFQALLKQREALDRQILRMQGRFFKMMERSVKTGAPPESKKYVARMQNHTILAEAIRESMIPGERMGMKEILCRIQKTGTYQTQSSYFYTMVNNKLNRDPLVKKVSRGVFVLQKEKTGRPRKVAV